MKIRGNTVGTPINPNKVLVKSEKLTEEEKAIARANIGAANADNRGNLYLTDEVGDTEVNIAVCQPDEDETGYVLNGVLAFLGPEDSCVKLIRLADGQDDWDAATVGQVKKAVANIPDGLPTVSVADAGKFLRVSADGEWQAQTVVNAEEVAF